MYENAKKDDFENQPENPEKKMERLVRELYEANEQAKRATEAANNGGLVMYELGLEMWELDNQIQILSSRETGPGVQKLLEELRVRSKEAFEKFKGADADFKRSRALANSIFERIEKIQEQLADLDNYRSGTDL